MSDERFTTGTMSCGLFIGPASTVAHHDYPERPGCGPFTSAVITHGSKRFLLTLLASS